MSARPRIKPESTPTDRLLDATTVAILIIMWAMVVFSYNSLPDTIAIHFNAAGEANGYGSKATMFIFPAVGTATIALLFVMNMFPHTFNYPVTITEENAARQYGLATKMVRWLNVCMAATFAMILYSIQRNANMGDSSLMPLPWLLPVVIALPLVPVIWYIIKARKER